MAKQENSGSEQTSWKGLLRRICTYCGIVGLCLQPLEQLVSALYPGWLASITSDKWVLAGPVIVLFLILLGVSSVWPFLMSKKLDTLKAEIDDATATAQKTAGQYREVEATATTAKKTADEHRKVFLALREALEKIEIEQSENTTVPVTAQVGPQPGPRSSAGKRRGAATGGEPGDGEAVDR